jgi:hypothetical protein
MNGKKKILRSESAHCLSSVINNLKSQRHKIAILAGKTGTLRARGQDLLAESILLSAGLERSSRDLADTYVLTKKVLTGLPLRGSGRQAGVPLRSQNMSERIVEDSPDMVEALEEAAEILKMEFAETQGSGRETLLKCEKVLGRTKSVFTLRFPLY